MMDAVFDTNPSGSCSSSAASTPSPVKGISLSPQSEEARSPTIEDLLRGSGDQNKHQLQKALLQLMKACPQVTANILAGEAAGHDEQLPEGNIDSQASTSMKKLLEAPLCSFVTGLLQLRVM